MYKWSFDRKYLKEKLIESKEQLKNPNLSLIDKFTIMKNIDFLENMLKRKFSNRNEPIYIPKECYDKEKIESELPLSEIKALMINQCLDYYIVYGQRAINLIIKLYEDNIFYIPKDNYEKILTIEEQEEYTLKNYEKNSKFLYSTAKNYLNLKHSHIQKVNSIGSYCYYSKELDNIPFIIVDPEENNSILNHELQHGLEFIYEIHNQLAYNEIGSIFFELLFCDGLYDENKKCFSDFTTRVTESTISIRELYPFFKFIMEIKRKKFFVTDKEFIDLCQKYLSVDEKNIENYLIDKLESGKFQGYIEYLFSHLKAIELREKSLKKDEDKLKTLMDNCNRPLTYNNLNEKILVYKRYLDEIEGKR